MAAAFPLTRAAAGLEEMWRRALSAYKGTDPTSDKQLLMDAIALPIFTYGPVVGAAFFLAIVVYYE